MKSVIEQMEENDSNTKIKHFRMFQMLPYGAKVLHAYNVAKGFYNDVQAKNSEIAWERERKGYDDAPNTVYCDCHVSVSGLDSITLLYFLRNEAKIRVPAISVSSLEDKSIQHIHKDIGVISLPPLKNKVDIIREYGFPVLSKETAGKISLLQNPTKDNETVRHAIMTGETGAYGGFRTGTRMKMSQKWLELFGGLENEKYGTNYKVAPFKVSDKCCYYLKEKPCDDWAKKHSSHPYLGLMASEKGRREKSLMIHGCNYWGKSTVRSAPFAIFNRQDLLRLALELKVPVPEIYGEIKEKPDGTLYTTRAQRTGCSMCGFGIHLEKRPHRFDRLYEDNPREWKFWMHDVGWGEVLDYIGVEWCQTEHSSGQLMWFPTASPKK